MCTNGSGTNSVKPPVRCCCSRRASRWRAQLRRPSTAPYMIVVVERSPTRCAASWTASHCSVEILSGHSTARTSSSRISAAVPGSDASPASRSRARKASMRHAERRGALPHLEGAERVHVQVRHLALHRAHDVEVEVAGERRVDAALQADLGRAAVPCLARPAGDLVERHEVRRAAQVLRQAALREGAEAAAEVADVGVVDVPRDDVGDDVAVDLAPHRVGGVEHRAQTRPARAEQGHGRVLVELLPAPRGVERGRHAAAPTSPGTRRSHVRGGVSSRPAAQPSSRARPSASARFLTAAATAGAHQRSRSAT